MKKYLGTLIVLWIIGFLTIVGVIAILKEVFKVVF